MGTVADEPSEVAVWKRVIAPESGKLAPGVAQALLDLRLSERDLDRADELSARARSGALTAQEERELDNYLSVSGALEFLKSKARRSLKKVGN